jgi:hypothetical protein
MNRATVAGGVSFFLLAHCKTKRNLPEDSNFDTMQTDSATTHNPHLVGADALAGDLGKSAGTSSPRGRRTKKVRKNRDKVRKNRDEGAAPPGAHAVSSAASSSRKGRPSPRTYKKKSKQHGATTSPGADCSDSGMASTPRTISVSIYDTEPPPLVHDHGSVELTERMENKLKDVGLGIDEEEAEIGDIGRAVNRSSSASDAADVEAVPRATTRRSNRRDNGNHHSQAASLPTAIEAEVVPDLEEVARIAAEHAIRKSNDEARRTQNEQKRNWTVRCAVLGVVLLLVIVVVAVSVFLSAGKDIETNPISSSLGNGPTKSPTLVLEPTNSPETTSAPAPAESTSVPTTTEPSPQPASVPTTTEPSPHPALAPTTAPPTTAPRMTLTNISFKAGDHWGLSRLENIIPRFRVGSGPYYNPFGSTSASQEVTQNAWHSFGSFEVSNLLGGPLELRVTVVGHQPDYVWNIPEQDWFFPQQAFRTSETGEYDTNDNGKFLRWQFDVEQS